MDMAEIGCVLMASGRSARYGRDKLLENLGGRAVILRTAECLLEAGLSPLAVTRSQEVRALMEGAGIRCVMHDGPLKCDTIRAGLMHLDRDVPGVLFMPGDQPLVTPSSIKKLLARFERCPERAVRLGYGDTAGSPVLFPSALRADLLAYIGDRGGMEVLRQKNAPCDVVQAAYEWELWDVDTPEMMERVRRIHESLCHN